MQSPVPEQVIVSPREEGTVENTIEEVDLAVENVAEPPLSNPPEPAE